MKRTLRLRSESLTELTPSELGSVAGGDASSPTCLCTRYNCYSLDQCPIPTLPLRECPING
jgi:hypothetical protein